MQACAWAMWVRGGTRRGCPPVPPNTMWVRGGTQARLPPNAPPTPPNKDAPKRPPTWSSPRTSAPLLMYLSATRSPCTVSLASTTIPKAPRFRCRTCGGGSRGQPSGKPSGRCVVGGPGACRLQARLRGLLGVWQLLVAAVGLLRAEGSVGQAAPHMPQVRRDHAAAVLLPQSAWQRAGFGRRRRAQPRAP